MKLSKIKTMLLVVTVAATMLFSSTAVFAAVDDSSTDPTITKTVNVAKGVTIDSEVTFNIEQVNNPTHDGNTFAAPVTGLSGTVTTNGLANATSDTGTKVVTIEKILEKAEILGSLTEVGEYTFKVSEKTDNLSTNWTTKDTNDFYLQVIVKNGTDGPVKTYSVTADPASGNKADRTKTDLNFTNTFTKLGSLEVQKTISTGSEYVDANKDFEFTVIFTGSNTATVEKYTANGAAVTYGDIDTTNNTVTGTFKLKKDGKVTFAKVPVGVTYTVTETAPTDTTYNTSVTKVNGTSCTSATATGNQLITETEGGDKVVVDNQYKTITPTGIIMSYLPYISMIALAIAAVALYLISKRREAARR